MAAEVYIYTQNASGRHCILVVISKPYILSLKKGEYENSWKSRHSFHHSGQPDTNLFHNAGETTMVIVLVLSWHVEARFSRIVNSRVTQRQEGKDRRAGSSFSYSLYFSRELLTKSMMQVLSSGTYCAVINLMASCATIPPMKADVVGRQPYPPRMLSSVQCQPNACTQKTPLTFRESLSPRARCHPQSTRFPQGFRVQSHG